MSNLNDTIKNIEKEINLMEDEAEKEAALERLKAVARVYTGDDEVISWADIARNAKQSSVKIMTGWGELDDIIKGFRPQQVVTVSAATKSGKTSWMVEVTARMKEYAPLWFPFEESAEELSEKFVERGLEVPKFFSPKAMMTGTTEWVEQKIVEGIAKYGTKVVVIDHLDFVVPYNADNHSLRMAQAMRDLKGLARKWDVVMFVICHLVKTKMDTQPTLEDLRGSAAIAQESDTVILLWREAKKEKGEMVITNNVNVSVQANRRHGKTGNVKMVYEDGRFLEYDWKRTDADREFDRF